MDQVGVGIKQRVLKYKTRRIRKMAAMAASAQNALRNPVAPTGIHSRGSWHRLWMVRHAMARPVGMQGPFCTVCP